MKRFKKSIIYDACACLQVKIKSIYNINSAAQVLQRGEINFPSLWRKVMSMY